MNMFGVRRSVTLGTFNNHWEIYEALKRERCKVCDQALDLLDQRAFQLSPTVSKIQLIELTVSQLGFIDATYWAICYRAHQLGLELCSAEVAYQTCLQCQDEPVEGKVLFGMEAISIFDYGPMILGVRRDELGQPLLETHQGHPLQRVRGHRRIIFVESGTATNHCCRSIRWEKLKNTLASTVLPVVPEEPVLVPG